jgi:copper chaperone CopZ
MKKQYQLLDLDCANCAVKMERAIGKIIGVNQVTVNFLTQKLTVDAEDGRFDTIMEEVVALCRRIEPDCKIKL